MYDGDSGGTRLDRAEEDEKLMREIESTRCAWARKHGPGALKDMISAKIVVIC